jgi:uncharacterized protein (TIGR03000 family)
MRKILVILGLVAFTVLASANDAFAQRRGGGGRGGVSVRIGGGYYGAPYYRYYGGRYYYAPYYGGPYYYSYGYSAPDYYYPPVVTQAPEIRQSLYVEPTEQVATVTVMVPNADAQVWFDNASTAQRGMQRTFHSPPLQSGTYTYTIKARWTENGQTRDQQREVQVQPGQTVTVDFRGNAGETLPTPIRQK